MKIWESTLARALRQQWKRYRRALTRCQARFTEKRVHESRVESRRLMAQLELLSIFAPAHPFRRARRVLKQHLDCLDTLRDTQVQVFLLGEAPLSSAALRPARDALRTLEKHCLGHARREFKHIKCGRIKDVISALTDRLEQARGSSGRQIKDRRAILRALDAAQARLVESRRLMDAGHVATIHRARVHFKRLRYMIEAMQPLLPVITSARLEAMHTLQSVLGELQDTDIFLKWLDQLLKKAPEDAVTLAPFRHWLLRRRAAQIRRCLERADEMLKFWPVPGLPRSRPGTAPPPRS